MRRSAPRQQAGLRSMEGDRQVGQDGRVGRFAARQVDRRRRVDGDDRDAGAVGAIDELDGGPDRFAKRSADAGPEQRIDDDRRLFDPLAEHRDVAGDRRVDLGDARVPRDAIPVPGRRGAGRSSLGGDDGDHDPAAV